MLPKKSTLMIFIIFIATACSPVIDLRGSMPTNERVLEIKPGYTKKDISLLLGTPASTSVFGDKRWYYIGSKIKTFAFFEPEELERQVIAIDFDNTDKVTDIYKLALHDGKKINISKYQTPTVGRDSSIIDQFIGDLIGNAGRFKSLNKNEE
ncbi:MAG: outer membrane protein assembly factor BamE [Rhodospirillaceae bacterium]|jgi:outer membrane protein assembly factor BamE (lipoprotein component of BamABCDE complex)|nr:outer membrane protein assembly factor BamE [Rhodospirillaceae bacterium]